MNVEIGTEAAQFPEKDYINGIFVAVWESYIARFTLAPFYYYRVYIIFVLFFVKKCRKNFCVLKLLSGLKHRHEKNKTY
jgi:hypothetical protein